MWCSLLGSTLHAAFIINPSLGIMKKVMLFFALSALCVLMNSCGSEKVDPANIIKDERGVTIKLTWTVNNGQVAATTVDLDMLIQKGSTESDFSPAASSVGYGTSESIVFDQRYANARYAVQVKYHSGTGQANYKVEVTGNSTNKTQSFTSYFSTSDAGMTANVIKLVKSGDQYTVENF